MSKASHSEVESYLKCERRHYYGYGLLLQGVAVSEAVFFGNCGHEGFRAYYTAIKDGITDKDELIEIMLEAAEIESKQYKMDKAVANKLLFKLIEMLQDYVEYHHHRDTTEWTIMAVEKEYLVEVPGTDYFMPFIVDLIVRDATGYGVIDNKFSYDFVNSQNGDLNPQLPKYFGGLKILGAPVRWAAYNEIRTRITKANEDNHREKYKFTKINLSPKRVVTTMDEQLRAAARIAKMKELPIEEWEATVLRAADQMNCKFCPFTDLCEADLNGMPKTDLIRQRYKPKERRNRGIAKADTSGVAAATSDGDGA